MSVIRILFRFGQIIEQICIWLNIEIYYPALYNPGTKKTSMFSLTIWKCHFYTLGQEGSWGQSSRHREGSMAEYAEHVERPVDDYLQNT